MVGQDNRGFLTTWISPLRSNVLAPREQKGKTGTRAFMAIGALLGEQHSFMHDLESFFWILFWICIHCDGPGEGTVVAQFDKWSYADTEELAQLKKGQISHEGDFIKAAEKNLECANAFFSVAICEKDGCQRVLRSDKMRCRKL
jgi:hypothetical protein